MRRPSMRDCAGLDRAVLQFDSSRHTALDRALLSSLNSGAFLSASYQAHFDLTKSRACPHCHQDDFHGHWPTCQGFVQHRPVGGWPDGFEQWPQSQVSHLLPPRNPCDGALKKYLSQVPDLTADFASFPSHGRQHLFTDGGCETHVNPWLSRMVRASWAVVNASSGEVLAAAPLRGLTQTSDCAEATAILAALRWAVHYHTEVEIWSDNQAAVGNAKFLQRHGHVPVRWENEQVWQAIADAIAELSELPLEFHWVPSHWDPSLAEDHYEDWFVRWNRVADEQATLANHQRSPQYLSIRDEAQKHHNEQVLRQRFLFEFYKNVATTKPETLLEETEPPPEQEENSFPSTSCVDTLRRSYPLHGSQCSGALHQCPPTSV